MNTPQARGPKDSGRTLQSLLGSMSGDAPRPGAKQATLAALGLGAAAATVAGTAGALGTVGVVAKFVAMGVLTGLLTTGAVVGIRHGLSPAPTNRARPAPSATSQPHDFRGPRATPGTPAPVPSAAFDDPIDIESMPPRLAQAAQRASSHLSVEPASGPVGEMPAVDAPPPVGDFDEKPAGDSSLRAETAQLDRARSAMAAGNAQAGLAELDRYLTVFPRGALRPEATLLRIKALVMTGDRVGAQALARSFAARYPQSPHLEQLRSLLEP
jgi:hypothetical protein